MQPEAQAFAKQALLFSSCSKDTNISSKTNKAVGTFDKEIRTFKICCSKSIKQALLTKFLHVLERRRLQPGARTLEKQALLFGLCFRLEAQALSTVRIGASLTVRDAVLLTLRPHVFSENERLNNIPSQKDGSAFEETCALNCTRRSISYRGSSLIRNSAPLGP